jgi:hypothetical protein
MMRHHRRHAAAIAVLMLCHPGAARAQGAGGERPSTPGADTVRAGCSGGMNGGSSGWLLIAGGRIVRFSGRGALAYADERSDPAAVARVFSEIDRIGLRSRLDSAMPPIPDAIICSVAIGSHDRRRSIRWLYGSIPPVIEPALAAIDSAVGAGESGAWRNHWQMAGDVWP